MSIPLRCNRSPAIILLGLIAAAGCSPSGAAPEGEGTSSLTAATYQLVAGVGTNKCLDVAAGGSSDGTLIQEWDCNGTAAQAFRVDDLGGGLSRLVNPTNGKCVDVAAAGTANGTQIQLWDCNGTGAQSFHVNDAAGGAVTLVNSNSGKCVDVSAQGTANGTKVQLWDCNGTIAQLWHPTTQSTTTTPPPPASSHVVAGYYPNWTPSPVRIRDVDARYNLIYLFAATPVGGAPGTTGAVVWTPPGDGRGAATNFNADLQYARQVQGRKIILSVGGAGNGMSFPTRAKSQAFVDSIVALYQQFGGFDGLDWNTFEGSQSPDTTEMIWSSLQLKAKYPGFLVTAPPAPWNSVDQTFCKAMAQAGALDFAAPQYYDGPDLATTAYLVGNIDTWVSLLGADKVVVGFGIWDQPNYWAIGDAVTAWNQVKAKYPTLRGAFDWTLQIDESNGWTFADTLGPLVNP
jgi:chitinase